MLGTRCLCSEGKRSSVHMTPQNSLSEERLLREHAPVTIQAIHEDRDEKMLCKDCDTFRQVKAEILDYLYCKNTPFFSQRPSIYEVDLGGNAQKAPPLAPAEPRMFAAFLKDVMGLL